MNKCHYFQYELRAIIFCRRVNSRLSTVIKWKIWQARDSFGLSSIQQRWMPIQLTPYFLFVANKHIPSYMFYVNKTKLQIPRFRETFYTISISRRRFKSFLYGKI